MHVCLLKSFQGIGINMQPRKYNRPTGGNQTDLVPKTVDGLCDTISLQAHKAIIPVLF